MKDPELCNRCLAGKMRVTVRRKKGTVEVAYRKCTNARCANKDRVETPIDKPADVQ